jgi:hypothetical protein
VGFGGPAASIIPRYGSLSRRARRSRRRKEWPNRGRHCERSEAILGHRTSLALDCFVALAMTVKGIPSEARIITILQNAANLST